MTANKFWTFTESQTDWFSFLLNPLKNCELANLVIPILHVRTLRFKEVRCSAPGSSQEVEESGFPLRLAPRAPAHNCFWPPCSIESFLGILIISHNCDLHLTSRPLWVSLYITSANCSSLSVFHSSNSQERTSDWPSSSFNARPHCKQLPSQRAGREWSHVQPLFGIFDRAKSRNNISRRRKCKVLQERFKKRRRGDFTEGHLWFVLKWIGWGGQG